MNRQRVESLILQLLDGQLDSQDELELAEALEQSVEARSMLNSHIRLHGGILELGLADAIGETNLAATTTTATHRLTPRREKSIGTSRLRLLVIASIAPIVAYIVFFFSANLPNTNTPPSASGPVIAHFARVVGVDWSEELPSDRRNEIRPGLIDIGSGLAEIEFVNGVALIIEGPSRLELESSTSAYLHYGKMRSIVPSHSIGFTVKSADLTVVDLGTEFGIEIDRDGQSEVHVFDGEIELLETHHPSAKRLLHAGQAVQFEDAGIGREIPADADAFVDSKSLFVRAQAYIEDLQSELKQVGGRKQRLVRQIRKRESVIRKSTKLSELKLSADNAKRKYELAIAEKPEIKQSQDEKKRLQNNVDQLVREKLLRRQPESEIVKSLDAIEAELTELKRDFTGRQKLDKQLARRLRKIQQERNRLKKDFRKARGRIRRTDPEVQFVIRQLNQEKRKLEQLSSRDHLQRLRRDADSKRKQFLSRRGLLMRKDGILVGARRDVASADRKIASIQRRMHVAQKIDSLTNLVEDQELNFDEAI